jgi:hypothetical protein
MTPPIWIQTRMRLPSANFCAHRIEMNLEPACVIVCPTRAILADHPTDPTSGPSLAVTNAAVVSLKPYKRTRRKLFYVGINEALLNPVVQVEDTLHLWASRNPAKRSHGPGPSETASVGEARIVYDVAHPTPWGSKIGAYLFTKSMAAGVLLVAALMIVLGADSSSLGVAVPAMVLIFTSITAVLLVADLKRPERFYFLLTRPNPRSWVVIGAWILIAYGATGALWLLHAWLKESMPPVLLWTAGALANATAGDSGWLFAQARGRDLWQSSLFTWHLIAQAGAAGAAIILLVRLFVSVASMSEPALRHTSYFIDYRTADRTRRILCGVQQPICNSGEGANAIRCPAGPFVGRSTRAGHRRTPLPVGGGGLTECFLGGP